jgi:SPP1 gp7 family putative phage head morphogenesis protein
MPDDLPDAFLLEPMPHAEAAAWLKNKPAVSRAVFDALLPELRARAIVITGIEDAAVVGEIRDVLAELPAGLEWEKAKKQLVQKLGPWIGADDPAGALKAREARAELLLRTHGFQAYQVTQHAVMRRQEDVFPYWQYLSSGDEKVRPAHAALNEVVAPAGSKFWADHSPPWQWGCRCRKVSLLPEEVEELKAAEASKPPEARKVLEGSALRLAEDGRLDRGPSQQFDIRSDRMRGKPGGYVFDPDSLALPLDQLEARYDPQTWREFRTAMEKASLPDGRTAWGWLNGEKARKTVRKAAQSVAKVVLAPGSKPRRPDGVASKVTASPRNTKAANEQLEDMLDAIEAVHGDGPLRLSMLRQGAGTGGWYAPGSSEIKWGKEGLWAQQIVHEIGHKIDYEALPGGALLSKQDWPELKAFWKALKDSSAFKELHSPTLSKTNGRAYMAYLQKPVELWARAYAQFIAEESGNPRLQESIAERLGGKRGYPSSSQWDTADFAPIREAMKTIFQRLQWYDPA